MTAGERTQERPRHRWMRDLGYGVVGCVFCPWTVRQCDSTVAKKPWKLYVRLTDGAFMEGNERPLCGPRQRRTLLESR